MADHHWEEKEWIQSAIAGDKAAFGQLYDRYFTPIFRYLRIRCGNDQDAEDLTEDVFIRAWNHLPQFKFRRGQYFFQAWLFRIAHNLLVDHYRREIIEEPIDHVPDRPDPISRIERNVIKGEMTNQMFEAIDTLEERSQQVIVARFFSGLSHRETARILDISESNVRVIQYRALNQLKRMLRIDEK